MATKDWKIEKDYKYQKVWFNLKDKSRLYFNSETNIANVGGFMPYSVRTDKEVRDYFFKTKLQALKYARAYMRKH